ncbi:MAG: hypothetical protein H6698_03170 [Myxococcales bacterium]|nr:hypothetical protein [Myxococcales bacterium]
MRSCKQRRTPRPVGIARLAVSALAFVALAACGARQLPAPRDPATAFEAAERGVLRAAQAAAADARPDGDELRALYDRAVDEIAALEFGRAIADLRVVDRGWAGSDVHVPAFAGALWRGGADRSEALAVTERCLEIRPDEQVCRDARPALLAELGRLEEAERAYLDLVEADPRRNDAREAAARLAQARGEWDVCAATIGPAVPAAPNPVQLRLLWATCLERSGDLAAAERELRIVAREHHDPVIGANYLLQFLRRVGRTAEATRVEREMNREIERRVRRPRMRPL